MSRNALPKCHVLTCPNEADPRRFARDVTGHFVMLCADHKPDHTPMPKPFEGAAHDVNGHPVKISNDREIMSKTFKRAARPPDPIPLDLAKDIINDGYAPTPREVVLVAHALLDAQGKLDRIALITREG